MTITAKVREVLGCRPFDGQHGRTWYYKLEMDNGDVGEIGRKKENAFGPGDPLTYTVEEGQYGKKFKEVKENGYGGGFRGNGGGGSRGGNESFALSYAKDICVAYKDDIPPEKVAETAIKIAEKFYNWLEDKKK